jgi:hypothetical protein
MWAVTSWFGPELPTNYAEGDNLKLGYNRGAQVSSGGDWAAACLDGYGSYKQVQVFKRTGSDWAHHASLEAGADADFCFCRGGLSISDDGDRVVVDSPCGPSKDANGNSKQYGGSASVYGRSGDEWTLQQHIYDNTDAGDQPEAKDSFGNCDMSGDGSTLVCSKPGDAEIAVKGGAGVVFKWNENKAGGAGFERVAKLVPTDIDYRSEMGRDNAISRDGSVIAFGSSYHTENYQADGAVFVFNYNKDADQWVEGPAAFSALDQTGYQSPNNPRYRYLGGTVGLSDDGAVLVASAHADQDEKGALEVLTPDCSV